MIKTYRMEMVHTNIDLSVGKRLDILNLYERFKEDIENGHYDLQIEKTGYNGAYIGLLVDWDSKYIMLVSSSFIVELFTKANNIEEL